MLFISSNTLRNPLQPYFEIYTHKGYSKILQALFYFNFNQAKDYQTK